MKRCLSLTILAGLIYVALAATTARDADAQGGKKVDNRVFEMRTHYAHPGKMDALHARFREHTVRLFVKHGMTIIGFWSPTDPKLAGEQLIYILGHASKQALDNSWKSIGADPEWKAAKAKSELMGPLVAKVETVYLNATDYSPIK